MKAKLQALWELMRTFMKIGLFTFGGGYAMIALIQEICVEEKHWLTQQELMDLTVVAESTPGPIAINCATHVGYKRAGFRGAVATTLGVVLPSFTIIYAISLFLGELMTIPLVANAFRGIQVAVSLLIIQVALQMLKKLPKTPFAAAVLLVTAALMLTGSLFDRRVSSVGLLLFAALSALLRFLWQERKAGEGK